MELQFEPTFENAVNPVTLERTPMMFRLIPQKYQQDKFTF